jgi:hypothetical protein
LASCSSFETITNDFKHSVIVSTADMAGDKVEGVDDLVPYTWDSIRLKFYRDILHVCILKTVEIKFYK